MVHITDTRAQKVVSYTVHQRTLQKRCLHMTNIGRSKALYPHHSCIVIRKSTEKMRPIQKGTFAESSFRSLVAESSFRSLVVLQYKKCSVARKSLRNTGLIDDYSLATSSFVYDWMLRLFCDRIRTCEIFLKFCFSKWVLWGDANLSLSISDCGLDLITFFASVSVGLMKMFIRMMTCIEEFSGWSK